MEAYILDINNQILAGPFEIETDEDFGEIENKAMLTKNTCCIKWSRSSDGQSAFWGARGATFEPHWYK